MQKDPFYELEMPIRCELFTSAIDNLIEGIETGGGKARQAMGHSKVSVVRKLLQTEKKANGVLHQNFGAVTSRDLIDFIL